MTGQTRQTIVCDADLLTRSTKCLLSNVWAVCLARTFLPSPCRERILGQRLRTGQ